MKKLSLNGQWEMKRTDEKEWIKATVPGSMYNDLSNAGVIEDPFFRDNEVEAAKLSNFDYQYRKTFVINHDLLTFDVLLMCFDGLDTIAEISINGLIIANTMNMHRTYEFDIKNIAICGQNTIDIIFSSPTKYIEEKHKEKEVWGAGGGINGIAYLRKAHYMFGWDWGPILPDVGIWREVSIKAYNKARIDDVKIKQEHKNSQVKLDIDVSLENWKENNSEILITLTEPNGNTSVKLLSGSKEEYSNFIFEIHKADLWWPNGFGKHPLYLINIDLIDENTVIDNRKYKVGLRTFKVNQKDDQWGRSFTFEVNGTEIFAMGADYIPEDSLLARCNKDKTELLIKSCIEANFNTMRVWGGGIYPNDYFYDLCDEYGLIVWQDLMYACSSYDFTKEFRENIRYETIDNMKRIRHHACLGLWCGNNEVEAFLEDDKIGNPKSRADYIKQFEMFLPELAQEISPNTFYWPSSPSSFGGFDRSNDENFGNNHNWKVWHGNEPFTAYRTRFPRFMSEFGIQSFPCLKTVESFTLPEDRNIFSYVMENHQKSDSGNEKIMYYISQYFKFPKDFESLLYVSQLIQAEGIRYGVEHWRRNRGRCMGTTYWQLNDCWPVASWAGIDSFGRWKALHYAAKRFFSPVLISACEEETKVAIHVTNETTESVMGEVIWKLRDAKSGIIESSSKSVEVRPLSSLLIEDLDFDVQLDCIEKKRSWYLEFVLMVNGKIINSGTALFVKAKHFSFETPKFELDISENKESFHIIINSNVFAKFVELSFDELDARFSDNYFDISAGIEKNVVIKKENISKNITLTELEKQIKIKSLVDSF